MVKEEKNLMPCCHASCVGNLSQIWREIHFFLLSCLDKLRPAVKLVNEDHSKFCGILVVPDGIAAEHVLIGIVILFHLSYLDILSKLACKRWASCSSLCLAGPKNKKKKA